MANSHSETKIIDKGFNAFMKELAILQNDPFVKVGVMGEGTYKPDPDRPSKNPPSMVDLATFNEFGAPSINLPERSFIRSTHDERRGLWSRMTENFIDDIMMGRTTVRRALKFLGLQIQKDIRSKIVKLKKPENKARTIARKKSSNPLVDTGQLGQSINFEVQASRIAGGNL